ncbi:MAG TPA: phospholipase D family protein [Gaiellaceae bacterium]|nr:phospholipase D family protein [Gaiellaceae bacterium]
MAESPDDRLDTTGRTERPADSVAAKLKAPRFLESATVKIGHAFGERIDDAVRSRHRGRLRRVGWEHALDAPELTYADGTFPARKGNALELLVDGSEALPAIAAEMARAESYVHLTGWFFSPELHLSREQEPVVMRNLLAELAERVDVRVLSWKGAPIPVFKPSQREVREMLDALSRHTKIQAHADGCTGFTHCHHEKLVVVDGRVAFVGGIDLTLDGGDPWDTPAHVARGGIGWHDAAVRIEGPAVADVEQHFRARWHGATREVLPRPIVSDEAGDVEAQVVRTVPAHIYRALRRGDYSILESYIGALRSAERFIYLESQFLWSPEIVTILADKLERPPSEDFRVLVLLPARANDGADISRGQVAALIHAADETTRFLACTIYARERNLRDPVYVHSKIGIVDDRWLTLGSANLNAHSLFHDTEMNVVTLDERLARAARVRLWSEHLELEPDEIEDIDPIQLIDEHWERIASEQLELLENGEPLTHRLVKLPGVSRRRRRLIGPLQSHLYDV